MTTTFFCIETGNSLYGGTVRHFFQFTRSRDVVPQGDTGGLEPPGSGMGRWGTRPHAAHHQLPVHRRGWRNRRRS